jgi:hypothetical protein
MVFASTVIPSLILLKTRGQDLYCLLYRNSVVGIATSYGLNDRGVGVRVLVGSRIFSSPDRPPNLLSNAYRGLFPRG